MGIKKLLELPYFDKVWGAIAFTTVIASCVVSKAPLLVTVGSAVGILFVLGVAFGKRWANAFGAALSLIFGYLSYEQGFFGNAAVNFLYTFPMSIYGLWLWNNKSKDGEITEKRSLSKRGKIILAGVTALGVASSCVFSYLSGSNLWVTDGISAILPIIATWLLINMYKEQWNLWLVYNALEVAMWFTVISAAPEMLAIFVMRVVFFINSVFGFINWNSK